MYAGEKNENKVSKKNRRRGRELNLYGREQGEEFRRTDKCISPEAGVPLCIIQITQKLMGLEQ